MQFSDRCAPWEIANGAEDLALQRALPLCKPAQFGHAVYLKARMGYLRPSVDHY
jgi:hypothetical protein